MLDLDFVGSLKHPLTDPVFAGQLKGRAFIGYLPQAVKDAMGGSMRGTLGTDLSVRLRRSDLAANRFHRILHVELYLYGSLIWPCRLIRLLVILYGLSPQPLSSDLTVTVR